MKILFALMTVLVLLASCMVVQPVNTEEVSEVVPLKVGFILVGPENDFGWNWAHAQGAKAIEDHFGDMVEVTVVEDVREGAEDEKAIRDLVASGHKVIFATSFGFLPAVSTVANEYQDINFIHISGHIKNPPDNIKTLFGRLYQPRCLAGIAAAEHTKSFVGFVAAFPIPEVIRNINAFTKCAREFNPDIEVRVVWTNTWYNPPQEKEAAEALVLAGADFIAQYQDSTAAVTVARDAGFFSIGNDTDMNRIGGVGPTVLTTPIWQWGESYIEIVQEHIDGQFKSGNFWYGMDTGIVDYAPLSTNVPVSTVELIEKRAMEIVSGEYKVFCGVKTNQGNVVTEDCLTDSELLAMDYFVLGVTGQVP